MFNNVDNQMSPDKSPNMIKINSGTKRVNNLPLYIICGFILCFFLSMTYLITNKSSSKNSSPDVAQSNQTNTTKMHAQAVIGEYKHGVIPAISEETEVSPLSLNQPINNRSNHKLVNDEEATLQQLPSNEDIERIRRLKIQQMDTAIRAKTKIPVDLPKTMTGTPAISYGVLPADGHSNDPTAIYQAGVAQLQGSNVSRADGLEGNDAPKLVAVSGNLVQAPNNTSDAMKQFASKNQEDRWRLDSSPEAPRTPYELRAGFVLPAILISGINSDLPGQIIAQVAQSVYDTPTGKHLLIPQGSKLVGSYSSEVAYGQSRVLVAWQRITFPDGKAMDIGAMPGADSAGYSGFNDQVNNHYFRIFGSAIMMSAITAGFAYSQDVNEEDDWFAAPTASSELSAALGQQLGDVASQMIAKNLNISPTLEIRPGYRFNVMVTKDITFSKPYQSFDY